MTTAMNQEEMQAAVAGIRALNKGTNKPYKPLTSKVERLRDKAELRRLELGLDESTDSKSVFMVETPQYGMTDKQREAAKKGRLNLEQLWVGNGGCNE